MHKLKNLISDIKDLGVTQGDIVLVHSSYKSIGKMEKGAETIVKALQEAITYHGLLLMPSFNMIFEGSEKRRRSDTWDIKKSKSTVGWITEYFRQLQDSNRSDHYSHSISGWGRDSIQFLGEHISNKGPVSPWDRKPWGKTYGLDSPFYKSYSQKGKIMMIGDIPWSSCTHIHFIETLYWNFLLKTNKDSKYPKLNSKIVGEFWINQCEKRALDKDMSSGKIGDANCKLFQINKFVDIVLEKVKKEPNIFLKK